MDANRSTAPLTVTQAAPFGRRASAIAHAEQMLFDEPTTPERVAALNEILAELREAPQTFPVTVCAPIPTYVSAEQFGGGFRVEYSPVPSNTASA